MTEFTTGIYESTKRIIGHSSCFSINFLCWSYDNCNDYL